MLRLKVALSEASVATRFSTDSCDRLPSPGNTKLKHMSMNTPGLTPATTTTFDTRKACQHYSWRAVKLSNNSVTTMRKTEENSDKSTAQLKEYTPRRADTLRRASPVLQVIQPVAESDNVAQATAHLGDDCQTTGRQAGQPIPARLRIRGIRQHLSDAEESAQGMRRGSKADADVVDEEACTHYTGSYTVASNSCGGKNRYVDWIEGDALQMRIELKFRFIRERMLAPEACNKRSLPMFEASAPEASNYRR